MSTNHFNKLTEAEAERLAILAEECAEVIKIVGKILRHGYERFHPDDPSTTNRMLLENEIGDVVSATILLVKNNDVSFDNVSAAEERKEISIRKYLHHQGDE